MSMHAVANQQIPIEERPKSADLLRYTVLVAYLAVSFFITHVNLTGTILDYKNFPTQLQLVDKVYHICAYGLLTFLVLFTFIPAVEGASKSFRAAAAKRLVVLSIGVLFYGLFDEVTQPYFGRRFEALDLLANCLGIAAAQFAFVVAEATGIRDRLLRIV